MNNLNDKYQLEQVRTGMPYNELIDAVKRNFSILLNAYIAGANVVEFTGMPGISGAPGARGASMFAINQQNLFKAMSVYTGNLYPITEDNVMSSVSNLQTAVQALLTQSASAAELFKGVPNVQSIQDIVQYDSILFNNGYLLTLTYTGQGTNKQFSVTGDIMTALANGGASHGSTGSYDIDTIVQKVLEQVSISANGIGGVTAVEKQVQYGGAYRKSYMPKSVLPDAPTARTLAFLAANTASDIKNVVLIAGTNEQLKQIYTALNMALDDTNVDTPAKDSMPIANFAPSLIVAQSAHGEKTTEPTSYDDAVSIPKQRFGMTIVNMDDIVANADDNVSDGASWSSFATISKAHDGMWLMSQSDDSPYGKVYLSKTRFELMLQGIFRLQAKFLKVTVSDDITVTAGKTINVTSDGKTTMSFGELDIKSKGATSITATTDAFAFTVKSASGASQASFTNNEHQVFATFKSDITAIAENDVNFTCQGEYEATYQLNTTLNYYTLDVQVDTRYNAHILCDRTVVVDGSNSDKESIRSGKIERTFLGNDENDERVRLVYIPNVQAKQDNLTFAMPSGNILVVYDRIHLSGKTIAGDLLNLDFTGDATVSVANYAVKTTKWSAIATGDAVLQANNLNIKAAAKLDAYSNELSVQVKSLSGHMHFPMFNAAGKLTYLETSAFINQLKTTMTLPSNFAPSMGYDRDEVVTLRPGETYDNAFADIAAKFDQLGKLTYARLTSNGRVFADVPNVESTVFELTDINGNEHQHNPRIEFTSERARSIYAAKGLAIASVTKKSDNSGIDTFDAVSMTSFRTEFYDKDSSRATYPNQLRTNVAMQINYGTFASKSNVTINRLLKVYAPMRINGLCLTPTSISDRATLFLTANHAFVVHEDTGTPVNSSVVLPNTIDIQALVSRGEPANMSPVIIFANIAQTSLTISVQNTNLDAIIDGRNIVRSVTLSNQYEQCMLVYIGTRLLKTGNQSIFGNTWLMMRFN